MAFGCSFHDFPMVCQFLRLLRVDPSPLVFPESAADQTGSLGPGGLDLSKDGFHSCFQPLNIENINVYIFIYSLYRFIHIVYINLCCLGVLFLIKHVDST